MISFRGMMKSVLMGAGIHERMFRSLLKRSGNRVVFLFHRVLPRTVGNDLSPAGMVVSTETFRRFLDWLPERFELPSPSRFLEKWPQPMDRPTALITFDDGWRDVIEHALPEMRKRSVGAIMFVPPRFIDSGELFWPERLIALLDSVDDSLFLEVTGMKPPRRDDAAGVEAMLTLWKTKSGGERSSMFFRLAAGRAEDESERRIATWDDLVLLEESGFEIGSHGMNHLLLSSLPEEEAREELVSSRARIAAVLGEAPRLIAYPNGDQNAGVRRLAVEAGYSFGFSLKGKGADSFDIPRINLHEASIATAAKTVWTIGRSA